VKKISSDADERVVDKSLISKAFNPLNHRDREKRDQKDVDTEIHLNNKSYSKTNLHYNGSDSKDIKETNEDDYTTKIRIVGTTATVETSPKIKNTRKENKNDKNNTNIDSPKIHKED